MSAHSDHFDWTTRLRHLVELRDAIKRAPVTPLSCRIGLHRWASYRPTLAGWTWCRRCRRQWP